MYKLDLHTHTISSGHAYSTLLENVAEAKKKGLEVLGMSDHGPKLPGGAHIFHFQNLKILPHEIDGIRVLRGVEANIISYDGAIDIMPLEMDRMEYAIASLHIPCINPSSIKDNTQAIIGAMKHKKVMIIGHPDDARYPKDYLEIVKAAKHYNKLLEVNNASLNPNGFRANAKEQVIRYLEFCEREQVKVICNSDAHFAASVGDFDNCRSVIDEIGFPKSLVVNSDVNEVLSRLGQ